MNDAERAHVVQRYAERLARLGPVVQALGWRDADQQRLRFDIIADGFPDLDGASVLDIGCGFGDFFDFLSVRGDRVRYTGCDLSPDVLAIARQRHPELTLECRNVLEQPYPSRAFDYVCMSGLFNHRIEDNEGFRRAMTAAAFDVCRRGMAANMTTTVVDYEDPQLYYFRPGDVVSEALRLTRRVALRHDYRLYEFTIFLYRDAS